MLQVGGSRKFCVNGIVLRGAGNSLYSWSVGNDGALVGVDLEVCTTSGSKQIQNLNPSDHALFETPCLDIPVWDLSLAAWSFPFQFASAQLGFFTNSINCLLRRSLLCV